MQAHFFLFNNSMNSAWIVSQLGEPVNDIGVSQEKGGAQSEINQAVSKFCIGQMGSELKQMEE